MTEIFTDTTRTAWGALRRGPGEGPVRTALKTATLRGYSAAIEACEREEDLEG